MTQFADKVVAVDFDGTLVENKYPDIGELKPGAKMMLNWFKAQGYTIILYTCRQGEMLGKATRFCIDNQIPIDYVNANTPERLSKYPDTRKISADIYIDDCNLGGFPGWWAVKRMLAKEEKVIWED